MDESADGVHLFYMTMSQTFSLFAHHFTHFQLQKERNFASFGSFLNSQHTSSDNTRLVTGEYTTFYNIAINS